MRMTGFDAGGFGHLAATSRVEIKNILAVNLGIVMAYPLHS